MTLRLTGLTIYPIKSARGIPLEESEVDQFAAPRPALDGGEPLG